MFIALLCVVAVAISCFLMSGSAKTSVLVEEGGNQSRKRSLSSASNDTKKDINTQTKKTKTDEMSGNEKKSNFSVLAPNSNGAVKMISTSSTMSKPGAATKKLVIKNFKSKNNNMFELYIVILLTFFPVSIACLI